MEAAWQRRPRHPHTLASLPVGAAQSHPELIESERHADAADHGRRVQTAPFGFLEKENGSFPSQRPLPQAALFRQRSAVASGETAQRREMFDSCAVLGQPRKSDTRHFLC